MLDKLNLTEKDSPIERDQSKCWLNEKLYFLLERLAVFISSKFVLSFSSAHLFVSVKRQNHNLNV